MTEVSRMSSHGWQWYGSLAPSSKGWGLGLFHQSFSTWQLELHHNMAAGSQRKTFQEWKAEAPDLTRAASEFHSIIPTMFCWQKESRSKQPKLKGGGKSLPLNVETMRSNCKIVYGMGDVIHQPSLQVLRDVGMGRMCFVCEENMDLGEATGEGVNCVSPQAYMLKF